MNEGSALASALVPPTAVEGVHGTIRLKWHKLRTRLDEAPFRLSNLALGWRLGASLEIDILAAADGPFIVLHDATLGPSTTGRGRVANLDAAAMAGLFHRDRNGMADADAPVLPLREFMARLRKLPRGEGANLQLDLKLLDGRPLTDRSLLDAAEAAAGLEDAIVIGSHHLEDARRLASAIPGARLGYDPMLAASRDPDLARNPERLLRHIERRRAGLALAYLRYDAVLAAEGMRFPLVRRLLDMGLETDAWTVNPQEQVTDATLHTLMESGVRQITTDAPRQVWERISGSARAARGLKSERRAEPRSNSSER